MPIEVETRDLGEVREVLALLGDGGAGVRVDRVMLDNMARRDLSAPGAPARGLGACRKPKLPCTGLDILASCTMLGNPGVLHMLVLATLDVPVQHYSLLANPFAPGFSAALRMHLKLHHGGGRCS